MAERVRRGHDFGRDLSAPVFALRLEFIMKFVLLCVE
jgi:hypothetical protein